MAGGVGIDLKHPGCAPDAQPLGHARQDVHDEVHWHTCAMKDRAVRFQDIAATGSAVQLAPRSTIGMAIGAQVPKTDPAPIITTRMGAEVRGGVDLAWAAVGCRHRLGGHGRGRLGTGSILCTGGTVRFVGQSCKGFGLVGALTVWEDGRGWLRPCRHAWARPGVRPHDKQPQESQDHQLGEKKVWNRPVSGP